MQSLNPIPHTWREAVWAIIAILLATRFKGLGAFCKRIWAAARASDKSRAEAEDIRTHTAMSAAEMITQMSINTGRQTLLTEELEIKLKDKDSIITMQRARLKELEPEETQTSVKEN